MLGTYTHHGLNSESAVRLGMNGHCLDNDQTILVYYVIDQLLLSLSREKEKGRAP